MAAEAVADLIPVIDLTGNARSGKGTIAKGLQEALPEVLDEIAPDGSSVVHIEETGVCYRAITHNFLERGLITVGQTKEEVKEKLDEASVQESDAAKVLKDNKGDLKQIFTEEVLYGAAINEMVPFVGAYPEVRAAVDSSFNQRLSALINLNPDDEERPGLIIADGRNLWKLVQEVPGAALVLKTFISCSLDAAVRRECARDGIVLESDAEKRIRAAIAERNHTDATRELNPVLLDRNARACEGPNDGEESAMVAAGADVQLHIDTTSMPRSVMLETARQAARGALLLHIEAREAMRANVAIS